MSDPLCHSEREKMKMDDGRWRMEPEKHGGETLKRKIVSSYETRETTTKNGDDCEVAAGGAGPGE